jgi:Flp pilus assembly protein TadG
MRRSRRWTDEAGSASLEFITAGMILLLPLVYLVLAVAAIQAGAFAAEGAARQAARLFVQAPDLASAQASAERELQFAMADHGIDGGATITVTCRPATCLTRQGFVTVAVDLSVPLPLVPPVLVGDFPLAVPLHATATEQVSRFWRSR